ncbi:tyrosine-type recombinase/integrase [Calidifontibacillus erzurumensis]|uniref:tyrosine-type recombinase/integrase n=1 Tax=Calidifontibacillus erzurumensis TaxID=2741433 RepID=UPI0035B509BB
MENKSLIINDNLIIKKDAQAHFENPAYFPILQQIKDDNERNNQYHFHNFSDIEMIYYYVHRKTHVRENEENKRGTKKEYIRNLLQLYSYLLECQDQLKQDIPDFKGDSLFKNLYPRHIRNYHEFLAQAPLGRGGKPYSDYTLQSKTAIIKSFFTWLEDVGYIHRPLAAEIKRVKIREESKPDRDLYYHEVVQIINFYKDHPLLYGLLTTLMITGLRIEEIANAEWKDISYDAHKNAYFLKGIGKRNKPFLKAIAPTYFERIKTFRKRRGLPTELNPLDETPVFATRNRKKYTYKNLSRYVVTSIEKTGLPFVKERKTRITPHSFRHAFAIYLYKLGNDIYYIQRELGHSDPKTTAIYLEGLMKKENSAGLQIKDDAF